MRAKDMIKANMKPEEAATQVGVDMKAVNEQRKAIKPEQLLAGYKEAWQKWTSFCVGAGVSHEDQDSLWHSKVFESTGIDPKTWEDIAVVDAKQHQAKVAAIKAGLAPKPPVVKKPAKPQGNRERSLQLADATDLVAS